ncbi:MAG: hypothetical protein IJ730_02525 [Alphaproteobacteria bacterium]|nr:hypothetical protein [Alphaproteobacteria bacterium]
MEEERAKLSEKKRLIMLNFDRLCNQNKNFSRLTGVRLSEFRKIICKLSSKWKDVQKKIPSLFQYHRWNL